MAVSGAYTKADNSHMTSQASCDIKQPCIRTDKDLPKQGLKCFYKDCISKLFLSYYKRCCFKLCTQLIHVSPYIVMLRRFTVPLRNRQSRTRHNHEITIYDAPQFSFCYYETLESVYLQQRKRDFTNTFNFGQNSMLLF